LTSDTYEIAPPVLRLPDHRLKLVDSPTIHIWFEDDVADLLLDVSDPEMDIPGIYSDNDLIEDEGLRESKVRRLAICRLKDI